MILTLTSISRQCKCYNFTVIFQFPPAGLLSPLIRHLLKVLMLKLNVKPMVSLSPKSRGNGLKVIIRFQSILISFLN